MYDALNCGNVDVPRLRQVLAGLPMPRATDGRLVLSVDVSNWLRPDAPTCAERLFCYVYGRSGHSSDQFIPGWPYSFVAALESGRTSWCQLLDAVRLGPEDDVPEVTAAHLRGVVEDLIEMGRWHVGDRDILIDIDAGYDAPRTAHLLAGAPGRGAGTDALRPRHATADTFARGVRPGLPAGRSAAEARQGIPLRQSGYLGRAGRATVQVTDRYGTARAMAWDRIHPRLTTRSGVAQYQVVGPAVGQGGDHGVLLATDGQHVRNAFRPPLRGNASWAHPGPSPTEHLC